MGNSTKSKPDPQSGKPRLYIPIAGTLRTGDWHKENSDFDRTLKSMGYTRVNQCPGQTDPGFWSGDLGGLFGQRIVGKSKDAWRLGGSNLARFIRQRRQQFEQAESVTIITHSHGGQVAAFALKKFSHASGPNYLFNVRLVTVDMPVRTGVLVRITCDSMHGIYAAALFALTGRWNHLYSERRLDLRKTWPRWAGARGLTRKLKGALKNIPISSHTGVLEKPKACEWKDFLDFTRPAREADGVLRSPTGSVG